MNLEFNNLHFNVKDEQRFTESYQFSFSGKDVYVLGSPETIVIYEDLAYEEQETDILNRLEKILSGYISDSKTCAELARLKGDFVILISNKHEVEQIVVSDTVQSTHAWYYYYKDGKIYLEDDYWNYIYGLDLLDTSSYNTKCLKHYFKTRFCLPSQTYVKGLYRLQPNSIYKIIDNKVHFEKLTVFPKTDDRQFGPESLLKVIGLRLNEEEYSVAYSTGIDSHHVYMVAKDKVKDLVTMYFEKPYFSSQKIREVGCAFMNSMLFDTPLTIVGVNMDDPENIAFSNHAVRNNPFKADLPFFMYKLVSRAKTDNLITGELGDEYLFLSGDLPYSLADIIKNSNARLHVYWRLRDYLLIRKSLQVSHQKKFASQYANLDLSKGLSVGQEAQSVLGNYWPMSNYLFLNSVVTGRVDHWNNAAKYFGKRMVYPYAEPLVHWVAANSIRPFSAIMDPKKEMRSRHNHICQKDINFSIPETIGVNDCSTMNHYRKEMAKTAPEIKKYFDDMGKAGGAIMGRLSNSLLFIYQFVMDSLERRNDLQI